MRPAFTTHTPSGVPVENAPASLRRAARGFTLLELLVVMVIIGLLASYVGPRYFAQIGKSEAKAARAQIDAFEKALEQYRIDTGHFPSAEQGLTALNVKPNDEPRWSGPYLKKAAPPDPWGHPYQYKAPGEHGGEYDLFSLGKDRRAGGTGEDADIGNW
ncbi:MAG TPA: type II secretion system major pseudopilin GspG [Burkholderiales bacterium]|nr:type II secretion system major pseudopilin GspG [Burkholderiales bacterium]